MTKMDKMIALNKKRSMTKKAAAAERNASRSTWDGCRPCVMVMDKHKKKAKQRAKAELRCYCY